MPRKIRKINQGIINVARTESNEIESHSHWISHWTLRQSKKLCSKWKRKSSKKSKNVIQRTRIHISSKKRTLWIVCQIELVQRRDSSLLAVQVVVSRRSRKIKALKNNTRRSLIKRRLIRRRLPKKVKRERSKQLNSNNRTLLIFNKFIYVLYRKWYLIL